MAKAQLHAQVFCHIPDPRIKLLVWEVDPKVCPHTALRKVLEADISVPLHLFFPMKSIARANAAVNFRDGTQCYLESTHVMKGKGTY